MPGLLGDASQGTGLLSNFFGGLQAGMAPQAYQAQMQQQSLQATYQALLPLVGGDQNLAKAAALNPEILKQIAPDLNTAPKITQVPDMFGNPQFYSQRGGQNPSVTALPVGGQGGGNAGPGVATPDLIQQVNQMRSQGQTPEQIAATLPDNNPAKGIVQGWIDGRGSPADLGFKAPGRQGLVALAQAMGLDEAQIKARMQFAHDLGNTKSGLGFRVESGQKMLNHMESLATNVEKLNNFDTPGGLAGYVTPDAAVSLANKIRNNPAEQKRIASEAQGIAQSFSQEKGKFLGGVSGGSMHEREKTVDAYNTDNPRSKLAGSLQADLDLFKGQFDAMNQQRDKLIGVNSNNPKFQITTPQMDAQMQRIQDKIDRMKGGAQPAQAQPGALPGGFKYLGTR